MRIVLVVVAIGLLLSESGGVAKSVSKANVALPAFVPTASPVKPRIDFDTQIKPIFQSKCMPCHFQGGKMYDRLPFDKPATIRTLGVKLFTRIKAENDRRLIEDFLAQSP
jgi:hypothetical protein